MSYLDDNILSNIQLTGAIDESRKGRLGFLDAVNDGEKMADPTILANKEKFAMNPSSNVPRIPYFTDGAATVTTQAGYDMIPSNILESGDYQCQIYTVFSGYRFSETTLRNNAINPDEYHRTNQSRVFYEMARKKQEILLGIAELNKSEKLNFTKQISQAAGATFVFNETTDELEVSAGGAASLFLSLQSLYDSNLIDSIPRIITSPAGLLFKKQQALENGSGNAVNKSYDSAFMGMDRQYEAHDITVEAGSNANGWAIGDGELVTIQHHPYNFQQGKTIGTKTFGITPVAVPFLNKQINAYMDTVAADVSGMVPGTPNYDNIMSHENVVGYWDSFWVITKPNTTKSEKATGIIKLNLKES
jgi:hypothetical protein